MMMIDEGDGGSNKKNGRTVALCEWMISDGPVSENVVTKMMW